MSEVNWSNGSGSGNRSKVNFVNSALIQESVQDKTHSPISSMVSKYKGQTLSTTLTPLRSTPPPPRTAPVNTDIRPPLQPRPSTQDLIIRLRTLLDSVISILRSTSPNPRIHSLHAFYDRIVDLLSTTSSSSSSINTRAVATLDPEMVEVLEMEWWNSEIVAAWFGPTRAFRERGLARTGGPAGGVYVKADMVYVGLHDE